MRKRKYVMRRATIAGYKPTIIRIYKALEKMRNEFPHEALAFANAQEIVAKIGEYQASKGVVYATKV